MVDIGDKLETTRVAVATATLYASKETIKKILSKDLVKGDALSVAKVGGIMAAKSTSQIVPLCHPIPLNKVNIEFKEGKEGTSIVILATVKTSAKTGVEMEALCAASIAGLTIYDMCKSIEKSAHLENIKLVKKSGGKSGDYVSD